MSVKRYEWVACDEHACHCDVVESAEGDMVDYEDYAALEARCASLAAENSGLNNFIKADCWVWDDKAEEYIDAVDCMPEIPATDAFLAELRAQGVDSAIYTVISMMNHQHPVTSKTIGILRVHAYQLRKGVQS